MNDLDTPSTFAAFLYGLRPIHFFLGFVVWHWKVYCTANLFVDKREMISFVCFPPQINGLFVVLGNYLFGICRVSNGGV